ncbi:MAG: WG repeat-containing protein [Pyrinomonadaceae bacterium]|nr:WG repeat-containing protein [Pyrinomonadaceae bacterium]
MKKPVAIKPAGSLIATVCLLLSLLLTTARVGVACSWDYPIWMIRSKTADPLYRFIKNGKAGYIDRSGKIVIEPKFEFLGNHGGEFHDGLLDISFDDAGYADTSGKVVISKKFAFAEDFSEGLAVARLKDTDAWSYIDRTGEVALVPRLDDQTDFQLESFSDGLALVRVNNKWGYIDHSGRLVIPPKFLWASDFHEGMAWVITEGPCSFFEDGHCSFSPRVIGKEMQGEVSACKFLFIDKSGAVGGKGYEAVKDFSEGLAPVLEGDKWGFIDKKGSMVIEPKFDGAEPFSDGMARVKLGDSWGYIDRTGALVIGFQYELADDFVDGLAPVGRWDDEGEDGEFYYIDKRGIQAIPEKFAQASHFFKGLAHVKLRPNKKQKEGDPEIFAYINQGGKKVFTYKVVPED